MKRELKVKLCTDNHTDGLIGNTNVYYYASDALEDGFAWLRSSC
jgi:hypothetical protein